MWLSHITTPCSVVDKLDKRWEDGWTVVDTPSLVTAEIIHQNGRSFVISDLAKTGVYCIFVAVQMRFHAKRVSRIIYPRNAFRGFY